jgi:hypothetical protein
VLLYILLLLPFHCMYTTASVDYCTYETNAPVGTTADVQCYCLLLLLLLLLLLFDCR